MLRTPSTLLVWCQRTLGRFLEKAQTPRYHEVQKNAVALKSTVECWDMWPEWNLSRVHEPEPVQLPWHFKWLAVSWRIFKRLCFRQKEWWCRVNSVVCLATYVCLHLYFHVWVSKWHLPQPQFIFLREGEEGNAHTRSLACVCARARLSPCWCSEADRVVWTTRFLK